VTWHVVTGDFPPAFTGGVAVWNDRLARALVAAGRPVSVWARSRVETQQAEAVWDEEAPFAVTRVRARSWNNRGGKALAKALRKAVAPGDVVVVSTWPMAVSLAGICDAANASWVIVGHGSELSRLGDQTPAALGALLTSSARWASVSDFLADPLRERGADVTVLPAPVPLDLGQPDATLQANAPLLVVARLTALKGVERAIRLAASMGRKLRVVGDGEARADLVAEAEALGATVAFEGRQELASVFDAYRSSAAVLALSRVAPDGTGAEGFGMVVVEASAHSVPVVVSNVGGLPEAAGPGLVLEDPDDTDRAAVLVSQYLADPSAGSNQRAYVEACHGGAKLVEALEALVMC